MKVAVTGATGIVGRFVVPRLVAEDVEVRALIRPGSDRTGLPADLDGVVGDLTIDAALRALVDGADALVHCAYAHVPGRYRGGEGDDRLEFWRTNLQGSLALFEHAREAGVSRLVLLSSRAVFGADRPWVSDDDPARPDTLYGALKLALEAHVSAYAAEGFCWTSLRPTGVYGLTHPVKRSKWFDLAESIAHGRPLPPARLATEVHGVDVASAVWLLLTAPADAVRGRAVNCADFAVDNRDVMADLAARLGRSPKLPPPATNEVRPMMRTEGLRALGWQPGGAARLERTLGELADLVSPGV